MVQEPSLLEQDLLFLIQTRDKQLEQLISGSVQEKNVYLKSVEKSEEVKDEHENARIICFIIGSDVEDPIQSAQRLHVINKHAKIILLAKNDNKAKSLQEAIKFSPFIGSDVVCLTESDDLEEKVANEIQQSIKAENYRAIIAETNNQLSSPNKEAKPAYNQQFINKLMDIAPIGIAIVNEGGKVLGWNKTAASIFDKFESQMLGKSMPQLFNKTDKERLENYLSDSFEKKGGNIGKTISIEKHKEQGKQILNITAAPFTYSEGNEKALILAIKDDTEREKARQELLEMNITLEERVEERTASLLAYQDQLRSLATQLSKAEENERQRLATELHDNLGQMLAVNKIKVSALQRYDLPEDVITDINDIKDGLDDALIYTRHLMSDLKPPPSLDQEDVRPSIKWLADKMKKHNLQVTLEDDELPKPVNDEIRMILVQCVRELLFNVIKHANTNTAKIRLIRHKKVVHIIVEDKGKGFKKEKKKLASDESGFGLFNISERIDLLGGSVDIESEPGIGTKVTLCAPLLKKAQQEEEPDIEKTDIQEAPESSGKIKVLLVDDHQMMRDGLRKVVSGEKDLTVIAEAANGKEAIQKAKEFLPDVVIMDVNMPVMDGIEATQKLKEALPDTRVIALSFHDDEKVKESMKNAGATAYLTKNEAFETLCATIRSEAKLADE